MNDFKELTIIKQEVENRLDQIKHRLAMINLKFTQPMFEKEEVKELKVKMNFYEKIHNKVDKDIELYLKEYSNK